MMMGEPSAVFPSIVRQNGFYLQSLLLIEGQYVVMQNQGRMVGQFSGVQVPKGKGAVGVNHCLHVDFSNFLDLARIKGILAEQIARSLAFHVTLLEAGVGFFNGADLLFAELLALLDMLLFEFEQTLVAASQSMAFHDFLDGGLRAVFTFQFQELLNVTASSLRVLCNQLQNALFHFERCCLRVGFMDGRQVSQSFKALFPESFPVFVELSRRDSSFPTDSADITEFFGQFERLKALVHDSGFRFHFLLAIIFLLIRKED